MDAKCWRNTRVTATVMRPASSASPAVSSSTPSLSASSIPKKVTTGMPAMPLEPPVSPGVTNSSNCMISDSTKVTSTKYVPRSRSTSAPSGTATRAGTAMLASVSMATSVTP